MSNFDDLDNFFLEGDLDNDPFAPSKDSNKRKSPGDVNVDDEVSVAKKARVPRIKLDGERLLSQKGIPALRKRARDLKLKGKGHEWGDASRLLSFYQDWLDDLFPKAKFLDALAMVEKAGHNKQLQNNRVSWINEGRPKSSVVVDEGGDIEANTNAEVTINGNSAASTRIAPIFDKAAASSSRPKTPELDDLFGDEDDIYNATPAAARKTAPTADEPDEDELDALMAMDAASGPSTSVPATTKSSTVKSIFGDGTPKAAAPPPRAEPDDLDDLDALMAEVEAEQPARQEKLATASPAAAKQPTKNGEGGENDNDDDLDALMAEAEAQSEPEKPVKRSSAAAAKTAPGFDDEEEAMAEMEGLW